MSRRRRAAKECQYCKRCGRKLSDPDSRIRGYGPDCYAKVPSVVMAQLEEAGQLRFKGID